MYYIIENNIRPDGIVNHATTARQEFGTALACYLEKGSKLPTNAQFTISHIMLISEDMEVLEKMHIVGAYKAPEEAPQEVPEEGAE